MTRILLLGCAGSGKTTLARRLSERTGAPVIDLDAIWRGRVQETSDFRATLQVLHAQDAWISDGNFAAVTFDLRVPRADLVVRLNRPRITCAWRAIIRTFQAGEVHRPGDLATVLRFIWNFERQNRPRIEALRIQHGPDVPVVRLRTDGEIAAFVERL
ncbi:AAA family ATPase [Phenylobacterium sp.]|uniref:AAA family ATPase n=1 Tax=Phenylobacterium sp. TaxID=1871053 RepID=UPI002737E17A|nr:AAA family ATPase [Phenylobacterium sp.]MDP3869079.1 dephospho-CoA kinase [Phenylobacterium sp.]